MRYLLDTHVISEFRQAQPNRVPAIDSLIAATALYGKFTLVTRNEADFQFARVKVLNLWR